MFRCLCFVLLLLLPAASFGQPQEGLESLRQRWSLLESHRARLERLLEAQVRRIGRLKSQQPGVRRDFQLNAALRENQELATRLTQLQQHIGELMQQLAKAYTRAIAAAQDPAERAHLQQRRAELTRHGEAQIVTQEQASPLDNPEDLEEKADLLKDSEDKIQRQLRRIQAQIARLQQREQLRRHSRAADDSLFVEESPRRTTQTKATATATPNNKTDQPSESKGATPDYSAPSGYEDAGTRGSDADSMTPVAPSGGADSPAPSEPTGSTLSMALHQVMDPSVLQELRRSERSGDSRAQLAALEKARTHLLEVARRLSAQAAALRKRARGQKPVP